jgi:Flp pilus assembly protein TadG
MRWQPRFRRATRGQSLVEFALIIPILLLLLMGILDFSRAISAYNSVSNAARSAARVAVVDQNENMVDQAAIDEAFGLDLEPDDVDFNPNVNADDPCVLQVCEVEVSVEYTYHAATPIIGNIIGPFTVRSVTRLPIEREFVSP